MCSKTLRGVPLTIVALEKLQILSIMSVFICILALVIWHANCIYFLHHIIMCTCLAVPCFTLSLKWHNFQKEIY